MFNSICIRNLTVLTILVAGVSFSLSEVYRQPIEGIKREQASQMGKLVKIRLAMKAQQMR
ncbi:MAG: hypothetical protein WA865_18065 [Spirulinaceae cyanobacterium]